jgi:hypothetical protein
MLEHATAPNHSPEIGGLAAMAESESIKKKGNNIFASPGGQGVSSAAKRQ